MMNKKLLIPSLLLLTALPVAAQKLTAEKTTVDVGRTGYEHPITAVFEFKTKGKVRVEDVRPDCQCTKVEFPKGAVGDRFQIRMTYDARQLGHFHQQAAVVTNVSSKPLYITMKGVVLEHYVDLTGNYPVEMGELRLDRNVIEFDDANKGDQLEQVLHIYNNGTKVYRPYLMHLPSYLTAQVVPEVLRPDDEGTITLRLNSSKLHDYGLTQTSVYLAGNPGDKVRSDREVSVSAVLLPAFPASQVNPAHIQLSSETINIDFEGKNKKTEVIDIVNTGQSVLKISSLQMFTPGLKISLGKRHLAPGESTRLKVTALRGNLQKVRSQPRVLMITNDPKKPKVVLTLKVKG
jgi:hypothetical protein